MKPKGGRPPRDDHRVWVTVWAAMTASILVCFALGLWVAPIATAENTKLERILMSLAAAYVIASLPAKRWLLAQAREIESVALRQAALLVPWGLCEVAAVTGIAFRLVTGSSHYYVFLSLALAGMLLNFPKRGD